MKYSVELIRSAEKDIKRLAASDQSRVMRAVRSLQEDPLSRGAKKLVTTGEFRLRAGDYRILYDVNTELRLVTVLSVRHRREAYR